MAGRQTTQRGDPLQFFRQFIIQRVLREHRCSYLARAVEQGVGANALLAVLAVCDGSDGRDNNGLSSDGIEGGLASIEQRRLTVMYE